MAALFCFQVDPQYVPPIYAADGKSYFWYNSVVMSFLFNLTKPLEDVVTRAQHQLGLSPGKRYVGVQVRQAHLYKSICRVNSAAMRKQCAGIEVITIFRE